MSNTLTAGMFSGCITLVKCNVPCQKRIIGPEAFRGCTSLTSYTENYDFIETISSAAFSGCTAFTTIVIPRYVSNLGASAFSYCSTATKIKWDKLGQNDTVCTNRMN
jgi:hypothetical protein